MEKIRWGILGTGNIAKKFVRGLAVLPDAEVVAVGSRTQAGADVFGDEFDVPYRHASYTALAAAADVDVVYVATPHNLHRENSLLCLQVSKAVLCEKAFVINAAEGEEVVPWWCPDTFTLSVQGQKDRVVRMPFEGNGYNYRAIACIPDWLTLLSGDRQIPV